MLEKSIVKEADLPSIPRFKVEPLLPNGMSTLIPLESDKGYIYIYIYIYIYNNKIGGGLSVVIQGMRAFRNQEGSHPAVRASSGGEG
ncbi:MAG: hypothetical protein AAGM46_28450 [Cyanobacteria bacterium J06582_2]